MTPDTLDTTASQAGDGIVNVTLSDEEWTAVAAKVLETLDTAPDLDADERAALQSVLARLEAEGVIAVETVMEPDPNGGPNRTTRRVVPLTGAPRRRLAPRPAPLPAVFSWKNDNINRLAVEAMAHAAEMEPRDGLAYGYKADADGLRVTFGLPDGPTAESLWDCLCRRGAAAVKMHFVLWARWYERPDKLNPWVFLNIAQACHDAGYKRHHKGGFKQRDKAAVWQVLDTLTALEVRAVYTPPNAKGKEVVIPGSLWARDVNARLQDQFSDLYGQARVGDPSTWEPLTFAYQPGAWFYHREWESRNRFVGKASSGLMKLDARNDEWAILMGGYLITQARIGRYRKSRITIGLVLKRMGRAQDKDLARRKTQYKDRTEAALNRLVDVGVIRAWEWDGGEAQDIEDWDDPEAIASYFGADAPLPPEDWRARKVVITWPNEGEAEAFEARRRKAITDAARRKAVRGNRTAQKEGAGQE